MYDSNFRITLSENGCWKDQLFRNEAAKKVEGSLSTEFQTLEFRNPYVCLLGEIQLVWIYRNLRMNSKGKAFCYLWWILQKEPEALQDAENELILIDDDA